MNNVQILLTVALLAVSVAVTRFLPFLCFGKLRELPPIVSYLGKVLPAAMMGLLAVWCFKDVRFASLAGYLPTAVAAFCVIGVHLWKRNTVLSIALGTAVYMVLVRIV